ncbi:Uncharacterised protein [Phocoenobacter uteri]|uniref:Uncharacterized protein n=1 Tax=Phocoenobacter uteri TaxID=146806 RepID=A0A379C9X6_9PAST|nr:hypothetical protein [Phocoenobacter uteri]MDG6881072.1 hypothetical protein [Phocoenobacter uteri]SUB59093.1 Uncharacterised protein [Phocoenobacter uteri]
MNNENKPQVITITLTGAVKDIKVFLGNHIKGIIFSTWLVGLGYSLNYPSKLLTGVVGGLLGVGLVVMAEKINQYFKARKVNKNN